MSTINCLGSLLIALAFVTGCDQSSHSGSAPSGQEGLGLPPGQYADESDGRDWPGYGRTYGEQHYSPLQDINSENVSKLGLAWSIDLPPEYSMSQPIAVNGTLYVTTGYSIVRAIDAATGVELWTYDSQSAERAGERLRFSWGTRGLAWWNGKVYIGTVDGRLVALNDKTGQPVWSVQTFEPSDQNRYITGAPRIFNGMVVIGHGGADVGPVRGYVTAYDAESGEQAWRFWTVPGNPDEGFENDAMRLAAETWAGEWWRFGGGGTVWNAITYDPQSDTLYLGTGNGAPHNHKIRSSGSGDNLFLSSIVALEGKTGHYKWHYQTNPGETWDYNAAMDMALAELDIDGQPRKVLITAPKNGFFYVIDRISGELISAEPFARVSWAKEIDLATGRPIETPGARFPDGSSFELWPGNEGAHNWAAMAYNPNTQLAYIPVVEFGSVVSDAGINLADFAYPEARRFHTGVNYFPITAGQADANGISLLLAWDPVNQREVWQAQAEGQLTGGVMTTAGNLVFGGRSDGSFNAYAAEDGQILWSVDAGAGVLGAPITYIADGKQYVTVLSGIGGINGIRDTIRSGRDNEYRDQKRRILTFVIGGTAPMDLADEALDWDLSDPSFESDPAAETAGELLYALNCLGCHGIAAVPTGQAPDLRRSAVPLSAESFASVLQDGVLVPVGMPAFPELTPEQTEQIRQYLRRERSHLRAREED